MSEGERRYSDEEFAQILRAASKPEETGSAVVPAEQAEGLTLDEIRAIAADVGLDPERVAAAAAMLPTVDAGSGANSFAGATQYQLQIEVPAEVPDHDLTELLEVARNETGQRGSVETVLGSLEWSTRPDVVQYHVALAPRDGRTRITVGVERTAASILTGVFSGVAWMLAVGITGAVLEPGRAGGLMLVTAGIGGAAATMTTIWRIIGRRVQTRAERLLSALAERATALSSSSTPLAPTDGEPDP